MGQNWRKRVTVTVKLAQKASSVQLKSQTMKTSTFYTKFVNYDFKSIVCLCEPLVSLGVVCWLVCWHWFLLYLVVHDIFE